MGRYSMVISRYPWLIMLIVPLLVIATSLISFMLYDLPDFEDPTAGFEPRGTEIGKRINSWQNLADKTGYGQWLSTIPSNYAREITSQRTSAPGTVVDDGSESSMMVDDGSESSMMVDDGFELWSNSSEGQDHLDHDMGQTASFCSNPSRYNARLVFEPVRKAGNLFSVESMKSMCELEQRTVGSSLNVYLTRCLSWSLGNYVAVMSNKTCLEITSGDVERVFNIIKNCRGFYLNGTLHENCWSQSENQCLIPDVCAEYNGVFNVLHYVCSVDFLDMETGALREDVTSAMTFLPVYAGMQMMDTYNENFHDTKMKSDGVTQITAAYFGIKYDLFNDYLLSDSIFLVIAASIILILMWIYMGSFFITIMTLLSMVFSLLLAYFIYTAVFQISFFPFMNICTVVILIGIGADDAFVYCDIWRHAREDRPQADHQTIVEEAFQHGALTMFVTSFTTAAAFYANAVSSITAVSCFGIYAGTAVLCNFLLTITWLPAAISLHDKVCASLCSCQKKKNYTGVRFFSCLHKMIFAFSESSRIFFDKLLPCVVIKLRFLWLVLLSALAIGGFVVVYFEPKLRLPTSAEFQVFTSSHLLERYTLEYTDKFWFEKKKNSLFNNMPITIVFGVKAIDKGSHLNPEDRGGVELEERFSISKPESQEWLLTFCHRLKNQTFYKRMTAFSYNECFIETFKMWLQSRPCLQDGDPCCRDTHFPCKENVFNYCLKVAVMELHSTPFVRLGPRSPGIRFDINNDTIRAVILEFDSIYPYTFAYDKMKEFWTNVENWVSEEIKTAPKGMEHGWFVSYLDYFDLQDSISGGTLTALLVSVGTAFAVMLITTRNIVISFFSLLSIFGTILVTVASLVLLGWELNILESITISVAVGLSIDFTIHYGIAYRVAPEDDRENRVVYSLSRMGSAIMMAALTTFFAGAMMMPSTVLSYTQLGTFLMLVMAISWLYSTFFFQSLCRIIGPQGNCGQIPLPSKWCQVQKVKNVCCQPKPDKFDDAIMNSNNCNSSIAMETHELQPLTTEETMINASPNTILHPVFPSKDQISNPKTLLHVNGGSKSLQEFHLIQPNNLSYAEVFLQGNSYITRTVSNSTNSLQNTEPVVLPNSSPDVPDIWIKRDNL
ncbi:protein dispatched homolog 1-like isoform X2 [Ptychodera flava]|uniref:protein dispatched homolog 1-like isoform X2 n=1 Tax=Ptychodera flava TaxID=63121 RepID=UPI00396A7601